MSFPVTCDVERPPSFQRAHVFLRIGVLVVIGWLGHPWGLLWLGPPLVAAILIAQKGGRRYLDESGPTATRVLNWILDLVAYLALLTDELLPRIAREGLARYCDVFVERSAFTVDEARRLLRAARAEGLGAKLHADQLSAGGGAELAAEVGAASADHLECASDAGIAAMARAGVVAVSLPLASLYLGQPPAPARRWIEAGVAVAVATDFNPGSAPSYHLPFALTLACTLQRMTPAEALKGATIIAARAIGLEATVGSLEPGKAADFAIVDAPDVEHWLYHLRANACRATVIGGRPVWRGPGFGGLD